MRPNSRSASTLASRIRAGNEGDRDSDSKRSRIGLALNPAMTAMANMSNATPMARPCKSITTPPATLSQSRSTNRDGFDTRANLGYRAPCGTGRLLMRPPCPLAEFSLARLSLALRRLMGDAEEVPGKGIRQAVELPHSVDPSGNLDPGSSCGGAHKREVANAAGSKGERSANDTCRRKADHSAENVQAPHEPARQEPLVPIFPRVVSLIDQHHVVAEIRGVRDNPEFDARVGSFRARALTWAPDIIGVRPRDATVAEPVVTATQRPAIEILPTVERLRFRWLRRRGGRDGNRAGLRNERRPGEWLLSNRGPSDRRDRGLKGARREAKQDDEDRRPADSGSDEPCGGHAPPFATRAPEVRPGMVLTGSQCAARSGKSQGRT